MALMLDAVYDFCACVGPAGVPLFTRMDGQVRFGLGWFYTICAGCGLYWLLRAMKYRCAGVCCLEKLDCHEAGTV